MQAIPQSADCCDSCDNVVETSTPGPQGPAGAAGADGADGADGVSPWTVTTDDFNMPAELANVDVEVADNTWMSVGLIVWVEGCGYMEVAVLPGGSTTDVTLTNLEDTPNGAYPDNVAPGTAVVTGAKVIPAGPQGPTGAAGGAPDTASYWTRVAEAALSAESNMSALATGYVRVTTGTGAPSSTATIPLAHIATTAATNRVLKTSAGSIATEGLVEDDEIDYADVVLAGASPNDINWALGRHFSRSIGSAYTFNFTNTDIGKEITVVIKNTAGAGVTATFTGAVWACGTTPQLNQAVNGFTVYKFSKNTAGDIVGGVYAQSVASIGTSTLIEYKVAAAAAGTLIPSNTNTVVPISNVIYDGIGIAFNAVTNTFTLPIGTYKITSNVSLFAVNGSTVAQNYIIQLQLYNVTGTAALYGRPYDIDTDGAVASTVHPITTELTSIVTLAAANEYSIRVFVDTYANGAVYIGSAADNLGLDEIYAQVVITRVA